MDSQRSSSAPKASRWPLRVKVEAALSLACALLAVLTAFVPDWIEHIFDASPDGGSGEAEWGIVVIFAAAALMAGWAARREWNRWMLEQRA
ncbi:MAG: ABC transporter permease [Proteobacteria bacterium]|nr:ABC transporter permease [Pseudomonadota bacterium]